MISAPAPVPAQMLAALVIVASAGSVVVAGQQIMSPTSGFALVHTSTLVVLRGQVEVQEPGRDFVTATGRTRLSVGYQVRTGHDAFASMTFFDGSTTEIEPDSLIRIDRLGQLPGGGADLSFKQEAGQTWNRAEKTAKVSSSFETTTSVATATAHGAEFRVSVAAEQKETVVEAVTDAVAVSAIVSGQIVEVELAPGLQTTLIRGQPWEPPEPAPVRPALRLDIDGPVAPWVVDSHNRSLGFHPHADIYATQIPGARYAAAGGHQTLDLPDPDGRYTLVVRGRGDGGSYRMTVNGTTSTGDRKSTRLNSSHIQKSRMPSSA